MDCFIEMDSQVEEVNAKQNTGRLNINTYTYKDKNLKNRKLKRKRKQKRKRGSLREGREAPPRRCPHPFRFCFRFRFHFRFFKFLFVYVYVLIFNRPVRDAWCCNRCGDSQGQRHGKSCSRNKNFLTKQKFCNEAKFF